MSKVYLPRYLSASSLNLWLRCQCCWKDKYILGRKGIASGALYFGQAMSSALEALHNGKDAQVTWVKAHNRYDDLMLERGTSGLYPLVARGLDLIASYKEVGVFKGAPESVFTITVPKLPVEVIGYRDLKTRDGFIEFKTSRAKWEQERIDEELQATVYWLGHREETGKDPSQATYVIMPTIGLPNVRLHQTVRTEAQVNEFYELVNKCWEEMGKGEYVANPKCPIHGVPRVARAHNYPVFDLDS